MIPPILAPARVDTKIQALLFASLHLSTALALALPATILPPPVLLASPTEHSSTILVPANQDLQLPMINLPVFNSVEQAR